MLALFPFSTGFPSLELKVEVYEDNGPGLAGLVPRAGEVPPRALGVPSAAVAFAFLTVRTALSLGGGYGKSG